MVCLSAFLLLVCWLTTCAQGHRGDKDWESSLSLCSQLLCRAGRECVLDSEGRAKCECVRSCPDHFSPVCGSNQKSYDNYCLLHRDACLTGEHVSVQHKGYCSNKKTTRKNKTVAKTKRKKEHERPVVCLQGERDLLHRRIVQVFRHHASEQSWYRVGMSPRELLWGRFYTCDASHDNFLDANEFLECVKENVTLPGHSKPNAELVRALCIDAIVVAGDTNSDWRLNFEEFRTTMDTSFKLPNKICSLEGKQYSDGAETRVDCNECICACGNWVCTSSTCDEDDDDFADDVASESVDDVDKKSANLLTPNEWKRLLESLEKRNQD